MLNKTPLWFDPSWYLQEYPDIARAGLDPLDHYLRNGIKEGRLPCQLQSLAWENSLWKGAEPEDRCLAALQELKISGNPPERAYAAFGLGRWFAWQGQWQEAEHALAGWDQHEISLPGHHGPALLEVEALTRSGQLPLAWRKLASIRQAAPAWADADLAASNLLAACAESFHQASASVKVDWHRQRLNWMNRVWRRAGLAPVQCADSNKAPDIDNLAPSQTPATEAESECNKPLITVIVPAFNAGEGILTALRSLKAQTLAQRYPGAVEVLLVDDASTDDTAKIAEQFAAANPGFRVLHQPCNAGAYAARNRALAEARGEFITVHDADDWSHPQKLEIQYQGLRDNSGWMACNSHWVRCDSELVFSRWRMEDGWVYRNTSSLMFRREVFDALGYWDEVRVDADTEYYYRIRTAFGPQSTGEVLPGVPLAFGRVVPTALTMLPKTHLVTQFAGVRADYRNAAFAWHKQARKPEHLYMPSDPKQRPFPAPADILR